MTHTGSPKKVIFSPNEVEIIDISSGKVIAKGVANHTLKVYMFSHFEGIHVLTLPTLLKTLYSSDSC